MHGRPRAGIEYEAPLYGPAVGARVEARRCDDLVLGNAGNRCRPGGRELLHMLLELVVVGAPVVDELMIDQILAHDHVEPRERDTAVRAGSRPQPVLGTRPPPGENGIDGDYLGAHLHAHVQPMAQVAVTVRFQRLVAPDHQHIRAHPLAMGVALGQRLRRVDDRIVSQGAGGTAHAGHVAPPSRKVDTAHVRSPEARPGYERDLPVDVATRAMAHQNGFAAQALAVDLLFDVGIDHVERLVPRDALPLVLSALARASHGVLQTLGMVHHLVQVQAAHAQLPVRIRVERITLHLLQLAVLGIQQDTAGVVAAGSAVVVGARDGAAVLLPLHLPFVVRLAIDAVQELLVVNHGLSSFIIPGRCRQWREGYVAGNRLSSWRSRCFGPYPELDDARPRETRINKPLRLFVKAGAAPARTQRRRGFRPRLVGSRSVRTQAHRMPGSAPTRGRPCRRTQGTVSWRGKRRRGCLRGTCRTCRIACTDSTTPSPYLRSTSSTQYASVLPAKGWLKSSFTMSAVSSVTQAGIRLPSSGLVQKTTSPALRS